MTCSVTTLNNVCTGMPATPSGARSASTTSTPPLITADKAEESSTSLVQSHLHTRAAASVFDVSHMGTLRVHGADRMAFAERLTPQQIRGVRFRRGARFGRVCVRG